MVVPTLKDSMCAMYIEAMRHGMVIIGTDTYANRELVRDGYNGWLAHNPVGFFDDCNLPVRQYWGRKVHRMARRQVFGGIRSKVTEWMKVLVENKNLLLAMQLNALTRATSKPFSREYVQQKWAEVFIRAGETTKGGRRNGSWRR
jgi:glycosyltransferase involved in cell wall biosynthesis